MSRPRGKPDEEGLALRRHVADKQRFMAAYLLPPYTESQRARDAALRIIKRAEEIEHGSRSLRLCVRRNGAGELTIWDETYDLPGPVGRWVDIDATGRMTPVPAAWVAWRDDRLAAVRHASRTQGAQAALAAGAEWDAREPGVSHGQ